MVCKWSFADRSQVIACDEKVRSSEDCLTANIRMIYLFFCLGGWRGGELNGDKTKFMAFVGARNNYEMSSTGDAIGSDNRLRTQLEITS